ISRRFEAVRTSKAPWQKADDPDLRTLYWHALASDIQPENLEDLCERLQIGKRLAQSLVDTAHLRFKHGEILSNPELQPSQVVEILERYAEVARLTIWLTTCNAQIKDYIARYEEKWQHIQPELNGDVLREMAIKPGPCYQTILTRLRHARLNAEIQDMAGERQLVKQWLAEGICDDAS
ncbi:MAG: hypothetical protein K8L99_35420, partial [Anaerolineae bacterium]|nr:hypothetical protein [Anaerolineae bacterium]